MCDEQGVLKSLLNVLHPAGEGADLEAVETTACSPLETLTQAVEAQLAALQQLCFKFEVQALVLTGGRQKWLGQATSELEGAVAALQASDRRLRDSLATAACAIGLSPESTMREVAGAAAEPWNYILTQQRAELIDSVEQVTKLSVTNRRLLAAGQSATRAALALLGAPVSTDYDASGSIVGPYGSAGLLNARA